MGRLHVLLTPRPA